MATTYRDIYNPTARAVLSVLMEWHIQCAMARPRPTREKLDAVVDETQDMWREWARTHDTRA